MSRPKRYGMPLSDVSENKDPELNPSNFMLPYQRRSCFQKILHPWVQLTVSLELWMESRFERLGGRIGRNPWRHILFCLAIVLLCMIGMLNFRIEEDGDKLWTPQDSPSALHLKWLNANGLPEDGRAQQLIVSGKSLRSDQVISNSIVFAGSTKAANVVSPLGVRSAFRLWSLMTTTAARGTTGGTGPASALTWQDVCQRDVVTKECISSSVLKFWDYNQTIFEADLSAAASSMPIPTLVKVAIPGRNVSVIGASVAERQFAAVQAVVALPKYPNGQLVAHELLLSTPLILSPDGRVTGSASFFFVMMTKSNEQTKAWEKFLLGALSKDVSLRSSLPLSQEIGRVSYQLGRSIDDEIAASVGGDIFLMVITYVGMIVFVCFALGRKGFVGARVSVGVCGVMCVFLGIAAGYSLASGFGVAFNSLAQILPFILVGIGVDDMFVISSTFDRTPRHESLEARMKATFRHAAQAITVTSVTDIAAFLLGSMSSIPAVSAFCIYASLSIFFTYLFQLLIFSSLLVLDDRRYRAHRYDILCCFRDKHRVRLAAVAYDPALKRLRARVNRRRNTEMLTGIEPRVRYTWAGTDVSIDQELERKSKGPGSAYVAPVNGAIPEGKQHAWEDEDEDKAGDEDIGQPTPAEVKDQPAAQSSNQVVAVRPVAEFDAPSGSSMDDAVESPRAVVSTVEFKDDPREPRLAKFFYVTFGNGILSDLSRVVIILLFLWMVGISCWGVTHVERGFDVVDVAPDDSYLRDFFSDLDNYYPQRPFPFMLVGKNLNYHQAAVQQQLTDTAAALLASPSVQAPVISWLASFQQWYRNPANGYTSELSTNAILDKPNLFYEALDKFLVDQPRFGSDIAWGPGKTSLRATRMHLFHDSIGRDSLQTEKLMKDGRAVVAKTRLGQEGLVFTFSSFYVFWDGESVIFDELIQNFIYSLIAVFAITLLFLVHPGMTLLVAIIVGVIDLELLASVYFWGLKVNSITVINLVMAVGLVVDYTAHLVHAFLHQELGTKHDRVLRALAKLGPAVLLGGSTTFFGIMPLAFSKSEIFRVFFRMFLGIITLGVLHGLLLVPVLLSLIGPKVIRHPHALVLADEESEDGRFMGMPSGRLRNEIAAAEKPQFASQQPDAAGAGRNGKENAVSPMRTPAGTAHTTARAGASNRAQVNGMRPRNAVGGIRNPARGRLEATDTRMPLAMISDEIPGVVHRG